MFQFDHVIKYIPQFYVDVIIYPRPNLDAGLANISNKPLMCLPNITGTFIPALQEFCEGTPHAVTGKAMLL